ncbi:cleavage stimulating factor 64-like [Miscanthus floridulus]|uniref:cleavage stimulating factor 64-like n=1 Tax=Miscanthus floridulus TaxID=154761 RepID=UPI00345AF7AD
MAAAASCRCSSVVSVGNIPYHASEDELRAACEEIGPVVSLRVATDNKGSNRPRGFAFVEYLDDETALSACRNLHGRALRGRDLRVGLAQRTPPHAGDGDEPVGVEGATHAASLLAPGARPRGAVTSYLAGLSRRQLRELLDALEREDLALMEQARREFAGLDTLIEQARVLLDMASAPGAAAANNRKRGARGQDRPGDSRSPEAAAQANKLRRVQDGEYVPGVAYR